MKRGSSQHRAFLRVLKSALRTLDTPFSLGVHLLIEHEEWDQLAHLGTDPRNYLDAPSGVLRYHRDSQASALVRKVPWPTSFSRKKAALDSFEACERRCVETNYFVEWLTSGLRPQDKYLSACRDILSRAKKWVSYVLGQIPETLNPRFGPGTVYELKGHRYSCLADKVSITPTVTTQAESVFRHLFHGTLWDRERLRTDQPFISYAPGNRFTTVPKDGKTDRGICIEPGGNVWCQLGVGDYLKGRLKRVGLNVARSSRPSDPISLLALIAAPFERTGQDIHRDLAVMASTDGSLATIDLRNASDTVASKLVQALLPDDWHDLLRSLRSPTSAVEKRRVRLEKFSSMGNGFTFELETLVFAALVHGVTNLESGREFWVYGDDIIVPSDVAADVESCLEAFGFEVNRKKSYHTGFFRESCGGDYFCGFDVRPYFVTSFPQNPIDWTELYNGLSRVGLGSEHVLRLCCDEVPLQFRVYGRRGSPGCYHVDDPKKWTRVKRNSITWQTIVVPQPLRVPLDRWDSSSQLIVALLGGSSAGLTPPNKVVGFRLKKVSVS